MNVKELDSRYVLPTYARFPLAITHGKGPYCYDEDGKEYIDLGSGIGVNALGYSDDGWLSAVKNQLDLVQHTSNLYYTAPGARLAEELCRRTGYARVFFSNSGAEANECAIKAARLYAAKKREIKEGYIITLQNSFHGRTVTTLAATGQDSFHRDFTPLTGGFLYAAPDMSEIRALVAENTCIAVMFEPVQGEGGVNLLSQEFVAELAAFCAEKELLLIADEVQTGNGRTGKLYACMHYGITPDITSTAKGLAGGLPLGATMMKEEVAGCFAYGLHGSTFGANPVCCAAALHVLSVMDEDFLRGVEERAALIHRMLEGQKGIKSLSGLGLMIGIETEGDAGEIIAACLSRGVLCLKAKHKVRLLPPLNIPLDTLEKAITVLREECAARAK